MQSCLLLATYVKVEVSVRSNTNRNKSDLQYDDEILKNVFCLVSIHPFPYSEVVKQHTSTIPSNCGISISVANYSYVLVYETLSIYNLAPFYSW